MWPRFVTKCHDFVTFVGICRRYVTVFSCAGQGYTADHDGPVPVGRVRRLLHRKLFLSATTFGVKLLEIRVGFFVNYFDLIIV